MIWVKEYPLPLAPIKEQKAIVSEIESKFSIADNIEESINQSLQHSEAMRQSILMRAFDGQLNI